MSQLYPKTTEQDGSSGVTYRLIVIDSLEENNTGRSKDCVMMELEVPSNNFSSMGGTEERGSLWRWTNFESTKQWVDPESTSAGMGFSESERRDDVRGVQRELGSERVELPPKVHR